MNLMKHRKWVFVFLSVSIIGPIQYLNHTGFCYRDMQYLSERELIDRFLFDDKAKLMSENEKIEAMKHREYPSGVGAIKYPGCCIANDPPAFSDEFFSFLDKTFIGRYLVSIHMVMPVNSKSDRHPYEHVILYADSCGISLKADSKSIDISPASYESTLERNNRYWQEKENKE